MNTREVFLSPKKPRKGERWLRRLLLMAFPIQVLLIILWDIPLSIPSFLMEQLEEFASSDGWAIETTEATISLSGKIRLENARIHIAAGDLPTLAFARELEVRLPLGSVLFGRFVPVNAVIEDGWFLASAQNGIAPIFEQFSGRLHAQDDSLRFVVEAKSGTAQIDVRGTWDAKKGLALRKPHTSEIQSIFMREDFPELHAQILAWADKIKNILTRFEQPVLCAHLSLDGEKTKAVYLLAESNTVEVDPYTTGPLHCEAKVALSADKNLTGALFLDARTLQWHGEESNITIGRIISRFDGFEQNSEGERKLPLGRARLENLSCSGKFESDLPEVHLEILPLDEHSFSFFAGMGTGSSRVNLVGKTNPFAKTIEGSLSLFLQPEDLSSQTLKDWREKNLFQTEQSIRAVIGPTGFADANFTITPFRIAAEKLVVCGSQPAAYRIRGNIFPDGHLLAHDMYGKLGQSEVSGSFRQDYTKTNDYRFLLEGTWLPTDLNPWLQNWWDSIWLDFTFGQEMPQGDFDIKGNWGSRGTRSMTYGSVGFKDLVYKGLPLEEGSLKVIVNREKTRLVEVRLKPPQGEVEGELSLTRSQYGQPIVLGFDLQGDLNPTQCRQVFGPVAEQALVRFETNATASVKALGTVLLREGNESSGKDSTLFRIDADCPSPISYSGMPLEHLSFGMTSISGQTKVNPLEFGFAGGKGEGSFIFHGEENASKLDLDLAIHQVNRASFVEAMRLSNAFSENDGNDSDEIDSTEGREGILDLFLSVSGQPEDLWSFEGNGTLLVEDASLGDIRLFGSLSDFLSKSSLPLPTGSLRFTRMDAPFTLEGERATFGKLSLSGLTSLLVANGEIDLSKGILDLEARMHLLGNVSVPLLSKLVQFVDPLSAIGNVKIGGTFENPKWKLQIRPGKGPFEVLFPNGLPPPRGKNKKK